MSADEYAARWGGGILASGFDEWRYGEPALDTWVHRLHEILRTPGGIRACQERLLTREEIVAIRARDEADGL